MLGSRLPTPSLWTHLRQWQRGLRVLEGTKTGPAQALCKVCILAVDMSTMAGVRGTTSPSSSLTPRSIPANQVLIEVDVFILPHLVQVYVVKTAAFWLVRLPQTGALHIATRLAMQYFSVAIVKGGLQLKAGLWNWSLLEVANLSSRVFWCMTLPVLLVGDCVFGTLRPPYTVTPQTTLQMLLWLIVSSVLVMLVNVGQASLWKISRILTFLYATLNFSSVCQGWTSSPAVEQFFFQRSRLCVLILW